MHKRAWKRSKLYDDENAKWTAQQKKYKAWKAAGSTGSLRRFKTGEVKAELTVAQKKAALQAQIDALG